MGEEENNFEKKEDSFKLLYVLAFLFLAFAIIFLLVMLKKNIVEDICGDGTPYNECSLIQPYFCAGGILIEDAFICGCSNNLTKQEESCISQYQTNPKTVSLKYVLRGEENEIGFEVYGGIVDYLKKTSPSINSLKGEAPSRGDFKLKKINEPEQRVLLLPLVIKIQDLAKTKEDQMRIAVSLVQNIPYGESNETILFAFRQEVNYSRYPYEVLYEQEGICGEKSELLSFLLREIGYEVAFFYYLPENHEALGIKCPLKYSAMDSGYCFIETTGPSIITNDKNRYIGGQGSLYSNPQIIPISEGNSLPKNLYEYGDAKDLIDTENKINKQKSLNLLDKSKVKELIKKYGLAEIYSF